MIALIFASGDLDQTPELNNLLNQVNLIIAADGGAKHCVSLGIIPDILVGDFDSIAPAVLADYQQRSVAIYRHPVNKDATDLQLALELAIERGTSTIWLLGVLGGRWDMSLSNILLSASSRYSQHSISILGKDCFMHIFHPQKTHKIVGQPGQTVSLLAIGGDVEGVTLKGVEYPLDNQNISFGTSLGVSNVLTEKIATLHHNKGVLLCIQLIDHP